MEKWIIWCNLNVEQDALKKLFGDKCVSIQGSTPNDKKEEMERQWREGEVPILISKPKVFGFGMNWQHCSKMAFVGLSDSFEQLYQAIRRCWRFGQTKPVDVYIITAKAEGAVVRNIQRKEDDFNTMLDGMISATQEITKENIKSTIRDSATYETSVVNGPGWELRLGDCVEETKQIADNSIHYTVFSPPFANLYTYSNSDRDMGNCKNDNEFLRHFEYLVSELLRVTIPGRLLSFHCMELPMMKSKDGVIGLKDLPGMLIKLFQDAGFIYHSKVVIWKDPVVEMQRTKALGLLHKQIKKDSVMCRQGMPDYLITMRKPGENPEKVCHTPEEFPVDVWQRYASPVWTDIRQSDTLQRQSARVEADEKHICPLQLEVIQRGLELWTNVGDTVLDPFNGIGSSGYVALKMGREYKGIELKPSYFDQAVGNLKAANEEMMDKAKPFTVFDSFDPDVKPIRGKKKEDIRNDKVLPAGMENMTLFG
ncbi:MAG: DNA methyltransferase [Desulfitobacterium hafniense]|nr:DNA methyltransferase [Desulfitobacterium hafniense]